MSASDESPAGEPSPEEERLRRQRRLAEVFGDVLPEQTSDDREDPSVRGGEGEANDAWLRRQVPPHHG